MDKKTNNHLSFLASLLIFSGIIAALFFFYIDYIYPELTFDAKIKYLTGPQADTHVSVPPPTPWENYHSGSNSRMAVLLMDDKAHWLDLAHGLKTIGIPFTITTRVEEAIQHKVVLVYPASSASLNQDVASKLGQVAKEGGLVLGINASTPEINDLFGIASVKYSEKNARIKFLSPEIYNLNDEREKTITIGKVGDENQRLGALQYTLLPDSIPVALYEDGSVAISEKKMGAGKLVAIGLDFGDFIYKAYSNQADTFARNDDKFNKFEPSIDVILRLLKQYYQQGQTDAVTLGTVPFNHHLTLIITHDIDYKDAYINSEKFALFEKQEKISATYFLQTKYIKDYYDTAFFDSSAVKIIKKLSEWGMEIGSHSVSHSEGFATFPIGTGKEIFPRYKPYNINDYVTFGGTVLGEIRVSKFLLESFSDEKILSFRSGYLKYPRTLPGLLSQTGYLYNSSVLALDTLTHLPFQQNYSENINAEVNIFQIPTTEDEGEVEDVGYQGLAFNFDQAAKLADKIAAYGGVYVLLLHPSEPLEKKYNFEQQFVKYIKDKAWISSIKEFGAWWSARNKVAIDVLSEGKNKIIKINAPFKLSGLTLEIPKNWVFKKSDSDNIIKEISPQNKVVLNEIYNSILLEFVEER